MPKDTAPIAWWELSTGESQPIRLDREYVRDELRKRVWSQSDLATAAGLSKQMVSDLLKGVRAPSPRTVRSLAASLDVLPRKLVLDARTAPASVSAGSAA